MMEPSLTCSGSSSSLASSSWSRTGSSAEGSQSDFLPISFLFRFFSPPTNFLCLTSANHLLLGINASVNFLIYCSCATRWREAPFLFFRTISSKVRPVSGSKPAWGTLSQARRKARGAISWGKSLGFEICIVVLVIVFFAIISFSFICLCFTKETYGQNGHNWAKCSWQLWVWTCLFLFENFFCQKFLHFASLFMNIYGVPLEIALKCDCKVLGLRLTSGNKATQGANFTITHWC